MADIDLPVWSIPPNWSTPITERLEWLTDVMTSRSMAEQRRAIRLTPRRFFEYRVNPVAAVRSYMDQIIHRISADPFLLPLWHDQGAVTEEALTGATRLDLDTRWMEFEEEGLALLYFNPFKYEVVEYDAMDDDGLELTSGLADDWDVGSKVYPLRRALLDPEVNLSNITSRTGGATLAFMVDDDNPYDAGAEPLTMHEGYPVVVLEPNRMDALEQQFTRVMDELDLRIGRVRRYDENPRSFQTQFYNWQAVGREAHHKLRQQLYRLKGRQKAVWMPSFNEDVTLAVNLTNAQNQIQIQNIGYHTLGGLVPGRDRLLIRDNAGTQRLVKLNGSAAVSEDVERLNLTANAGFAANAGTTGSFVELVRLDQDIIEITHHTDSMGVCEASAAFRAFSPARVAPAILVQPVVEAVMNDIQCGISENVPCPIFFPVFDGWDYEISMRSIGTLRRVPISLYVHRPVEFGGDVGGGNAYGGSAGADWNTLFGPTSPGNQGKSAWVARRVKISELDRDKSFVGIWHAFVAPGQVNRFGTPAADINSATYYCYARHFSEPFPGRLVATRTTSGQKRWNPEVPMDKDWRDYR